MKKVILLFFITLLGSTQSYCQTEKMDYAFNYQTFDTDIFKFVPFKREGVTDQAYNLAITILDNTKSATKGDPKNLTFSDFWNITSAFIQLKEPSKNIEITFKKAIALDAKAICSYIQMTGSASKLEKAIPETFLPFYANCLESSGNQSSKPDVKQYALDNNLDVKLVCLMSSIGADDQKFRVLTPVNWDKQHPLDIKNRHLIDSLYAVYKTYIGKTLVGKDYESVMWAIIQHSPSSSTDTYMMEKYLPEVSKAVEQNELAITPLKMLIDRIYTIKYHYQIFGSQTGVPVADEKTKSEIRKKYNID